MYTVLKDTCAVLKYSKVHKFALNVNHLYQFLSCFICVSEKEDFLNVFITVLDGGQTAVGYRTV